MRHHTTEPLTGDLDAALLVPPPPGVRQRAVSREGKRSDSLLGCPGQAAGFSALWRKVLEWLLWVWRDSGGGYLPVDSTKHLRYVSVQQEMKLRWDSL